MSFRHFPHVVYLIHHLPTNSYGCASVGGTCGLACFARTAGAHRFARQMETRRNLIVEMRMADVCEVAAQVHLSALILADDENAPLIHRLHEEKSLP